MGKTAEPVRMPRYLFVIAFLVALTVLLAGTYVYYLSAIDSILVREYQQLSSVAWTRTDLIDTWRKERMGDAQVFATAPLVGKQLTNLAHGRADQADKTAILESLQVIIKAYHYSEALVLGHDLRLLISTGSDPDPVNPTEENAIRESLRTGASTLSDLYRNAKGIVVMAAVAPFSNSSGEPAGVVVLRIDAQGKLFPMMEAWPTKNDTVESALCRRDGDKVVVLTNVRRQQGTGMTLRMSMAQTNLPVVQAVLGNVGMYEGYDIRGVDVLADLRPVPGSQWFMVTKTDMPELIAEARDSALVVGMLGVMAVMLLGGALAYVYRERQSRLYRELYQSEKLQREAQESFRTTLYSIGDAVITTDGDGLILQMNPVAERLTGWSEQDAAGKPLVEVFRIINEDSREPVDTPVEDVMRTGKLVGLANHTLLICSDGSERPIADSASPITEEDGSVSGVVLVFRDQTRERATLQRLRDNEQRLTIIADHIYDWEYWLGNDNRMEFCSPSCERLTGHTPDQFLDDPELIRSIVHPDDIEIYDRHLAAVKHNPETCECDYRIITCDGKVVWLSHCCTPVSDSDGKPLGRRISNRDVTERKLVEQTLQDSEKRFRTAFMTSPDAITLSRLTEPDHGFYVDVNQGFYDLTGYGPDEVIGKSTLDIDLWLDLETRRRFLAELQDNGVVRNLESRMRLKDGQIKTALISARIINLAGAPHVLAISRDVDDWKKAEQSRIKSEERFRQVAELAGEWIWEVDENGLYKYCSAAVFQMLGYSPEELVEKRFLWELLSPEDHDEQGSNPVEHFQNKQAFHGYTSPHLHKDGRTVIIEVSGAPMMDDDGRFMGYRGTNTDITQRVKATESQQLLAAVVEHAAESIVVTDTEGIIQYVNPAYEQTTGYSKDEAIDADHRILTSGKLQDSVYADMWKTIGEGKVWRGHIVNKKKGGTLFHEDVTVSPIRNSRGRIVNYVALKRDVTREMTLQNQLLQSQKMEAIGTLAGGIAHDFNNILFAIIGYTEMAIDEMPPESRGHRDLEQVLAAAKRAADMVKQILMFSRQTEPQRKLLDLTPIVKEGLKFLRGSIPSTIEIHQEIEPLTGQVEADPTQMHQVLMNLCSNAAQAMKDANGTMTVELSEMTFDEPYIARHLSLKPGPYVKLAVSDTGYGIPPENIDRIFEPYFTTKGIGEGTGLGLAVIHGIVADHGGAITVYSIPGQGSTFNVFLPMVQRSDGQVGAQDSQPVPLGNERILLVEDEEPLLDMGRTILERLGYRVVTALDPLKALDMFKSGPDSFDLVLTDLMMPNMTGMALAKQIKILNPDIPIILCTGFGHKFTKEDALNAGLTGMIRKPVSRKDMGLAVRKALDGRTRPNNHQ